MNWMQKHALMKLIRHDSATLKDLRPSQVESNLFSYHLYDMKRRGLIESPTRGRYRLTAKGMHTAGMYNTATENEATNIKGVIVLYARRGDEVLLYTWSRQPYFAHDTLPHDRWNFGDSLETALETALQDKLHLTISAAKPVYRKTGMIKVLYRRELLSHMMAVVYEVNADMTDTASPTRNGQSHWASIVSLGDNTMSGLGTLVNAIEDTTTPLFDCTLAYGDK